MNGESPEKESERTRPELCANEGCARVAPPGERFCEACDLDRSLFQRDLRAVRRPAEAR